MRRVTITFLRFIESHVAPLAGKRVLDVGCGVGGFAKRLSRYGCRVTGLDASPAMIEKARRTYGDAIDFVVGDGSDLPSLGTFSLITSIMTLQFVSRIEEALAGFAAALESPGHLIFAVHNPAYFQGDPDTLRLGEGVEVPIAIRTAADYHAIASRVGLRRLLEEYPPFTEEFIERYPVYAARPAPEYLILGYEK